nr:hypothetical protein [Tanacetum cinerariifolium]
VRKAGSNFGVVAGERRNNHPDFHLCMFSCFLSQEEPTTVAQALTDPDWVEAMQAEMQQFRNQKVSGSRPQTGRRIDYTDVFAPVARIKAIRLFLAFASFIGFKVYQMNVKSAFLCEKIAEEVYVTQPRGFEDPDHPKKVYKVVKALYGLHQAPKAWYERLYTFLLKHGYRRGSIDQTLFIKKDSNDIMRSEFEMSSMGPLTFFLGLQVDQRPDGIFIHQEKYWLQFTSAGRVIFCWLLVVSAGHKSFLLVVSFSCWYALTANPTINASLVRKFWASALEVSLPDGVKGLVATIDGTSYTVTEASIRSALRLDDLNAIDTLTNAEIFDGLRAIGYATEGKFTFFKNKFSPQWKFLIHTLIHCISPKSGSWNQFASNIAIAFICLSTGRKYNFSNMTFNEVSPTPPSPVVEPHPSLDPMPSPPRQSSPLPFPYGPAPSSGVASTYLIPDIPSLSRPSELVLETITSPIRDDDTGGGSFHESPPSPPPATPTRSPTVGVAEEPLTRTSLLALFPTCLQRIATLEAELKATKNEEEARQSQELDALLHLANAALHDPSASTTPSKPISPTTLDAVLTLSQSKTKARAAKIIYKRLKKQQSSSCLEFTDAAIRAAGRVSAGGADPAVGISTGGADPNVVISAGGADPVVVIFAGGVDHADVVISAGGADHTVVIGGAESAGTFISAGVLVAAGPSIAYAPSSPIRDHAKGKAIATPSSPVTAPSDKELANQQAAILEAEHQELLEQELKQSLDRRKAIAKMKAKAKRDKPLTPAQQKEYMRAFVKNQSTSVYTTRAIDLATIKDHHQQLKHSGETLESSESKKLKSSHSTEQSIELSETTSVSAGATIAAGDPISAIPFVFAVPSVFAASSIPAETPIAASVSTTAGVFESAFVPIVDLLDSPPKATSLPLDPATAEQAIPLRKSSRKKSIARRSTLPRPSQSESAALPFDEDDPEAKFKKYLRPVSDDDEPAEPVSLSLVSDIRTWEIIPTEFGLGRADLMVLYGMVSDKYKLERATAGDIMYMFVDKKYPILPATIQRMLNHGLEINQDPSDLLKVCRVLTMSARVLNCSAFKLEEIVMAMITYLKSSGVRDQCFTVVPDFIKDSTKPSKEDSRMIIVLQVSHVAVVTSCCSAFNPHSSYDDLLLETGQ